MRGICIVLVLITSLCEPAAIAGQPRSHAGSRQPNSPAWGMLQSLRTMTLLLDRVNSRSTADAAAPRLLELNRDFHRQQAAAENAPPADLHRHLADMDQAMNDFRLACARVMQEKCYGSSRLGKAIRQTANEF